MRSRYPLFQSHLALAHHYWEWLIKPGQVVIDATCGNGKDTLKLCQLLFNEASSEGKVYAIDIQKEAIDQTKQEVMARFSAFLSSIYFIQDCHSQFPPEILPQSVALIAYNLGYLPGGDKTRTTEAGTTLRSLQTATELLMPGGALSITCYPGHREGKREEIMILDYAAHLKNNQWSCCYHNWINRSESPSLIWIQKAMKAEH